MQDAAALLQALQWRYACKKFDPQRKIAPEQWQVLEQSLVLTPSSFGLQPWKFLILQDSALKERLVAAAWNQRQVADCSHLTVILTHRVMSENHIDANIERMIEVRGGTADALTGFRKMLVEFRAEAAQSGKIGPWAQMQAYIALGQLMLAAAMLEIDTCPMEGFVPEQVAEVLGLSDSEWQVTLLCPLGYRAEDDRYASLPKVRFAPETVIEHR